jgi:hypothetical protein
LYRATACHACTSHRVHHCPSYSAECHCRSACCRADCPSQSTDSLLSSIAFPPASHALAGSCSSQPASHFILQQQCCGPAWLSTPRTRARLAHAQDAPAPHPACLHRRQCTNQHRGCGPCLTLPLSDSPDSSSIFSRAACMIFRQLATQVLLLVLFMPALCPICPLL